MNFNGILARLGVIGGALVALGLIKNYEKRKEVDDDLTSETEDILVDIPRIPIPKVEVNKIDLD